MDIREQLTSRWRKRQAEIRANLVQTKAARKRASRDMKFAMLDACLENSLRTLDRVARGVALREASRGAATADAAALCNDSKAADHSQISFAKYPLRNFARIARDYFMALPFQHPAPRSPMAQTANCLP